MIVKNRNSIALGKGQNNNQGRSIVSNPKRKKIINNEPPPPEPDVSDVGCLNLTAGLYKKKYEGYFNDINEFFDTKLVNAISNADIGKSYQILDIGTSTQQDWYNWGFIESPQYDMPEALGLPFPSIGKGVSYFGGGPIENTGTANLGPVLVSESVTSQIDDNYSQAQGQNNKSLIIKGYFKPTVNGVYKFRLISDDASYLWFGNDAFDNNRNINNSVVAVPGIHGPYPVEGSFTMTANSYYPLTVEFGNGPDGEGVLIFEYMPPGSNTWTSNLAGKLFYDTTSKGHRECLPLPGSLLFNDPSQFLQFPRSEVISILAAEPFTIEAWIKPTSIKTIATLDANGNPDPLDYGDIIIGDTQDSGNNWSLQLFNNKLTFYRYKNTAEGFRFFTSNSEIQLNAWTHVAVSYDGGSTLSIFINGTLDRTFVDYSPPDTQYGVITIGNLFNTGTLASGNGAFAYKGYITNLRINDNQFFYQYIGSFEPTAPLGYISGTTLMLLAKQNEPIKDSGPSNITITNVGSVNSSSQYPTVADCANNDAKVLMVGWFVGPRVLTRTNENLYSYFDETLYRTNTSSPWIYANVGIPLATSLTVSQFPWQAVWPSSYTATKVCPAPIGIPVSTTNEIVLSGLTGGYFSRLNGTYSKSSDPSNVSTGGVNGNGVVVYYNSAFNNDYGSAIWFSSANNKWYITGTDDNDFYVGEVSGTSSFVPFGGFTPSQGYSAYEGTIAITAVSETNFTAFSGATTTLNSSSVEANMLLLKGFKGDYGDYTNRYLKFVGGLENRPLVAFDGAGKYFILEVDADPNNYDGITWRLMLNSSNYGLIDIAYYRPPNPYDQWFNTLPITGWVFNNGTTGSIIFRKDTTYPTQEAYTSTLLPSDVQGLKIWLKADAGVTTTSGQGGNRVTAWADQAGSNLSVRNEGINGNGYEMRPLLIPNVVNGYPVVRYDNSNRPLSENGVPGARSQISAIPNLSQTDYSIYIVQKFSDLMESRGSRRHIVNIGAYHPSLYYSNYPVGALYHNYVQNHQYYQNDIGMGYSSRLEVFPFYYNDKYGGRGFSNGLADFETRRVELATSRQEYLSKFRVLALTHSASRGVLEISVDGVMHLIKNVPSNPLPNLASGFLRISNYRDFGIDFYDNTKEVGTFQDVAEVVLFNRSLSQEENVKIINGLKAKYNL
jgi:hypothetical protein